MLKVIIFIITLNLLFLPNYLLSLSFDILTLIFVFVVNYVIYNKYA